MAYVAPLGIPKVKFPSCASPRKHSVGTLIYDQDYNHDLVNTKVELRSLLKQTDLALIRAGFPFHCTHGSSSLSYTSYEFLFRDYFRGLDKRAILRSSTFRFTSPTSKTGMMTWSIIVPERRSLQDPHRSSGSTSIGQVQMDPAVMETFFGVTLMTNPKIVQEALALSIELGTLITVQMTNRKAMSNLYAHAEISFRSTNARGETRLVCTYKL